MHYLSHLNCLECDTETQVFTKNRLWINSTASLGAMEIQPNMYFLLTYDLVSDYMERREAFRDDHIKLALSAVEQGELLLGGSLTEPSDGAVLLFTGNSAEVAEKFAEQDPYVQNGLVDHWKVRSWSIVLGAGVSPQNLEIST